MTNEIICGHAPAALREIPEKAVHCCVTSPPYWGLRDYGVEPQIWGGEPACEHRWGKPGVKGGGTHSLGGQSGDTFRMQRPGHQEEREKIAQASTGSFCESCGAWLGSLGLEPSPEMYVSNLVEIFEEVRRVLRDDGTLWLNLGDSYVSTAGRQRPLRGKGKSYKAINKSRDAYANEQNPLSSVWGVKPKNLVGIPWRVAFALQAAGWYLRSDIIWAKPNPMPESVTDRPTKSHEYIFLLSKSKKYHYDHKAILEEFQGKDERQWAGGYAETGSIRQATSNAGHGRTKRYPNAEGRNKRSVWTIATTPYRGAHYAVFPEALIIPCIKAGCPEGGIVLDPFFGRGTTGLVALKLGRKYIGIELNREDCVAAEKRIRDKMGLFLGKED